MIIVADTSPIISLSVIGKLDLLKDIFEEFIIPEEVYRELTKNDKPYSEMLKSFLKTNVRSINNHIAVEMLNFEIDKGESEAIILAIENNIKTILIDDYKARQVAMYKNLNVIGTIGLLLKAKMSGLIKEIKPLLDNLIAHNIRISNELYLTALSKADE